MLKIQTVQSVDSHLHSGDRVIQADRFMNVIASEEILEQAHERANEILLKAGERAQKIKKLARRAYLKAKENGKAHGMRSANEELLKQKLDFGLEMTSAIENLEDELSVVVGKILEKMFGDMSDEQKLTGIVKGALSEFMGSTGARVIINPEHADFVAANLEGIEVQEDRRIDPDRAKIELSTGVVETSVSQLTEYVIEKVRK